MRFDGTDTALMVLQEEKDANKSAKETNDTQEDEKGGFEATFKRQYKAEFGFLLEEKNIIVDDIKVRLVSRSCQSLPFPVAPSFPS